jgi:SCP-2 sterol transfer family
MSVPEDPNEFFTRYVPERFAAIAKEFAGTSSAGSLVFRVRGAGEWSFRLKGGVLGVEGEVSADAILQISVSRQDFELLVLPSVARFEEAPPALDKQLVAFRALSLDAERAQLIRGIVGSVSISISDQGKVSRIVLTPGTAAPNLDKADCDVSVELADFLALQQGTQNPIELLMNNKLRITGNAQIALALSGLFA